MVRTGYDSSSAQSRDLYAGSQTIHASCLGNSVIPCMHACLLRRLALTALKGLATSVLLRTPISCMRTESDHEWLVNAMPS